MFFLEPDVPGSAPDLVFSASDLVTAAGCEYQVLRKLDEKLGRAPKAGFEADEMLQHAAVLGDRHELKVLAGFVEEFGPWNPATGRGVYDVAPAQAMDRTTLLSKHHESLEALRSGSDVVFQAAFFDGQFHGRSDFLVRQADGSYAVFDTKLARHAKVTALLQLAAYGDQLLKAGITPDPAVTLILGATVPLPGGGFDYVRTNHKLAEILPVFRERRDRFVALTAAHLAQPQKVRWGAAGLSACGRCDYCQEQAAATDDLLLVARMTSAQRKALHARKIFTVRALAQADLPGANAALLRLQDQARMQSGVGAADGGVRYVKDGTEHALSYRVVPENSLAELPPPSAGDIFFDFEGDPLWQESATGVWGLEYLFGVVEAPAGPGLAGVFRPFWAHSREAEKQAFLDFLDYVQQRRQEYPDMHVYHYAAYEKTALRKLSVLHVAGEDTVDRWLREGLLVDLYQTVRTSIRISENSYSIKKLEPLYMGTNLRSGDVKDAGASVVAYAHYCDARDDGRAGEAASILAGISDYNEYDCLSTLALRDWLLDLARERGIGPDGAGGASPAAPPTAGSGTDAAPGTADLDELEVRLAGLAEAGVGLSGNDRRAVAMLAAAVSYHRRERKAFWWAHFDRCENGPDSHHQQDRNVFLVEDAEVLTEWRKEGAKLPERRVKLIGTLSPGSDLRAGSTWFRMYEPPLPAGLEGTGINGSGRNGWFGTEVLELGHEDGRDTVIIRDKLRRGIEPYGQVPVALTEDQPIQTKSLEEALATLSGDVAAGLTAAPPGFPRHPALDLVRRVPPRLVSGAPLPAPGEGPDRFINAITEAVRSLDHSYVAVQGPPGTGKTHVGSHVIARLVASGWKVGVVGQSHAVVENLLTTAVAKAGVDPACVAKDVKHQEPLPWDQRSAQDVARLLASPGGALIGGTAWTITGANVPAGSLDLLVIDEAGQFSLANTLAVAQASSRLLLLGDPQQLPQVSQGSHPEPVNDSALGWVSAGHATLPPGLGYFLADSWRMTSQLCRAVSELSYDGKLRSAPAADLRRLEGVPSGIETVLVEHSGNTTSSVEEAAEVVRQVRRHVGLSWHAEDGTRPLAGADILVVAAYNAQVNVVREALEDASLAGVRVGTVDKFQGQEAAVVIVSMACSAVAEAPRGMEFLLSRNRINVAVSRGQWRAVLVRSPELTNYLPLHPEGLEQLGGFIGLCQRSVAAGS
ncbi:TM0106 family RecB-like putative nuclease [Arthrobacter sp. AL08]|uniref:TM0106 family RecB-like putative nuclease n=1 Tax=Micrococcaceae TaxID=1268 RepID=UPI00249B8ABD|nr:MULTISPECIES: TM0106 family RecB-like putative nuclease [Micrococcaceae]MDI3242177.1 TM0106 family RecB-like putative nuclease [Arthrobacter sp. AL05]MDI3278218.1 TM0106 family RecB-like putative nuclease [Arthrobacter sp. AL08]MDJ0353230.1 TM0106 family RecB-like putative nuclease [Pseudarthrobacter sp. PH31-O2]